MKKISVETFIQTIKVMAINKMDTFVLFYCFHYINWHITNYSPLKINSMICENLCNLQHHIWTFPIRATSCRYQSKFIV